jgi:hypothetical protein
MTPVRPPFSCASEHLGQRLGETRTGLKITYISGNSYRIHDKFLVAEADFYGGPGGMAIMLQSIRAADSNQPSQDADSSEEALISHLETGLKELDRFRFVVAFRGTVVASTMADTPRGSRIPTEIRFVR